MKKGVWDIWEQDSSTISNLAHNKPSYLLKLTWFIYIQAIE